MFLFCLQRAAREAVFRASHIPWWLGVAGHVTCAVAGTVGIPLIYHQGKPTSCCTCLVLCVA